MITGIEAANGTTLETRELNGYDDSDFYAIYWNEAAGAVQTATYASTRYWSYDQRATVDAGPEVVAKARAWAKAHNLPLVRQALLEKAAEVTIGKRVRVVAGRKVPIGVEGVVANLRPMTFSPRFRNGYKQGPDAVEVALKLDTGHTVFTYAKNVLVLEPEKLLPDIAELEQMAYRLGWTTLYLGRASGYYVVA